MIKKILFLMAVLLLLIAIPASATIEITPSSVTTSSIMWTWDPITVQNLSIDGVFVCNFNPAGTDFVLSGLGPNEPHTITIITAGDSGSNTTTTLPNTNTEQSTGFLTLLTTWWYLGLIVILCVVGMMKKLGIFLVVASGVSLYALYDFIQTAVPADGNPYTQIPFLIYVVFFIIPLFLVFFVKGGVFK